ncbi:MAG: hypothetical protein PHW10_00700 [Candidatus Peribacteraceae bacterium]|nr:hypothetical protein [Candidatus Peribacteraceae bacterium]
MPHRSQVATAAGFTALLLCLGTADAVMTRSRIILPPLAADARGTENAVLVAKNNGRSVTDILQEQGYELAAPSTPTILDRIAREPGLVRSHVLLQDNDRVAVLSWMESGEAKTYFRAIKEALHQSFSPDVRDLRDELLTATDRPPVNLLTFVDPAISEDRILFARVRERLLELHLPADKEAMLDPLLQALSK